MLKQIRSKKIYLAILLLIGVVVLTATLFHPIEQNDVDVEFQFMDEAFNEKELQVLISPYRKNICGYEDAENFDEIHQFIVLFNDGKMQDYQGKGISKAHDYFIYAKYKNQYARIKYQNTMRLGQNKTRIKLIFDQNSMNGKVFSDKSTVSKNHYDLPFLNYLDQL
ncbi:hypothetical protein EXE10_12990 [Acinetobacter sp. WCHAc060033]|uniref:hypothetical protein n=2 Tax=unclassified Acinetobacter TaxID=196816 RepID=UPI001023807C|nr:hypothetical protein [Acinetobacter sp. WCHAc060033]RZG81520.1 hypothetical protein EXE10_12990 [Acinetobacter sp. WCHAc060033]